jgi:hypothetical protein
MKEGVGVKNKTWGLEEKILNCVAQFGQNLSPIHHTDMNKARYDGYTLRMLCIENYFYHSID